MIDAQDKQTQPLPLDEQPTKPKRGRPTTGKALSNAERQKAYRERAKAQRNEKTEKPAEDMQYLADRLAEAWAEVNDLKSKLELAEARADAMGNELAIEKSKRYGKQAAEPAYNVECKFLGMRVWEKIGEPTEKHYAIDFARERAERNPGTTWRAIPAGEIFTFKKSKTKA
ncbi:hypothetical protein [Pseudomonas sp. TCU-HL1]|uniref:hypothetical protein n=1 Tax=Pseudomonas sp. TCU-HL1 TaxID=1856685 RepID=UPI00083DBF7E|nr:hypothetical protein [Pseudomonas sp. TCU-HL1]AOE85549.1 hypothetical protein THL1_3001 [Pseudomonas sp. TCU-HL1]AOE85562.1 hypothetical protein THL1_3014 [Pseudomonas sp. TCU-HL1]